MSNASAIVEQAYRHCFALARAHYENFPVASWLLPRTLRRPIAAIYAFARAADDLADEGTAAPHERLAALEAYRERLRRTVAGEALADEPVFMALGDALIHYALPPDLLYDLLDAFSQDVVKHRYADFDEVMDYCRLSANPVGRLLLHLTHQATPENLSRSDAVCSALQLINFYQDLHADYVERGRLYLPLDELERFGVTADEIGARRNSPRLNRLMGDQFARADQLMLAGASLGHDLHGRIGLEVRAITVGGQRILNRLRQQRDDVFTRPRLRFGDRFAILRGAFQGSQGQPPDT
ncbi:squalene synthase HpnC [Acidihalobacter ferrooxydans]|uniref:Squalene synthase HpnC n=1 Tax=Acidihalobacter ferrooxydans TaxID=1765967 RepID=A0A1P8UG21_9GAMM|nr:squalene synthase HpnC [Acidihalobacter ferrooxydans]APZ42803.1 squalene synthase HpnC [Acidihalobacter ferrooxydans]